MACQITFLGLINFFDVSEDGGLILLPNGRNFGEGIPDHIARFYVPAASVRDDESNWPNELVGDADLIGEGLRAFEIDTPSRITINALEGVRSERVSIMDSAALIPSLNDNALVIDPPAAETIAQIPFERGELAAFLLHEAAVWVLNVEAHKKDIRITARHDDGENWLVVKDDTQIALGNMSDLSQMRAVENGPSHYSIYSRLAATHAALPDPTVSTQLRDIRDVTDHPLVLLLANNFGHVPRGGCSGSRYSSALANPGS